MNASLPSSADSSLLLFQCPSNTIQTPDNKTPSHEHKHRIQVGPAPVRLRHIHPLRRRRGIAVSGSSLFVASNANGTIGEYTTSGATVNASLFTIPGEPVGITAFGSSLFVTNGGAICEYSLPGATVNTSLVTGLSAAQGIAAFEGNLYVAEAGAGRVSVYTTSGATVNASLITGLNVPSGIAVGDPVPEPSAWAMLAAASLLGLRRRLRG